jgi:creatinine deaminase
MLELGCSYIMHDDQRFLNVAIGEATDGLSEGGIPIGACLVRGSQLLGAGRNRRVQAGDPTAHGEISAMRAAGRLRDYSDTVMYTTLMPCFMCAGTIVQFGIPRVVVGESVTFPGAEAFLREHGVEIAVINDRRCVALMELFAAGSPDLWKEDIGEPVGCATQ